MIMVGLKIRWQNCVGVVDEHNLFFECEDHHQAARETWKCTWFSNFQSQMVLSGEFHDTLTHKTWGVDANGHTNHVYERECESQFKQRWGKDPWD